MSARLVLGSVALDKREPNPKNLTHLLAGGHVPEAHLLGGTCGVSALAMPAKLIMRPSTHDWADKHRAVAAAADDLQTVVAELNAGHYARVPRHRALIVDLKIAIFIACTDAVSFTGVTNRSDLHTGNKDMRNR